MRALALLIWALALLTSTLGFALGVAVYDRGVVYGDPGPALPDLDGPQRAVNTQLEVEPDEESQRRALRLIREAGFGWIRQQFSWATVEGGGKGQYVDTNSGRSTWDSHDQIVRLARAEGLRVIARLDLPPAWARPPDSTKTHPPLDVRDYGDYVAAFVERYQGQIDHVQLWNEPNLTNEWGGRPVDPAAYVELLKAGYLGARRASPSVRVLSGMLAPTLEPDRPDARGLDDLLYLDRMYLHGAGPYFDILAGNAYGLHTGPEDRQVGPPYTNFPRLLLTREVMLRHGDGGKAVWVTEFGWNALPEGWTGDPSPWGEVSSAQQAEYIVGAYARARREWPWLGPLALWLFRQPGPDPRDPTAYFGLVDPEWRPRLAYDALRASAPPSGAPTLGPGVHQESAAGLVFGGTWQWTPQPAASLGALRESPISGATLRFRFRGTRLELLAPAGPTSGTAYVKVNGASTLANRLPLSPTGQAVLDLYAPAPAPQRRLVIADGLPDREHEVELAVTGQAAPQSGGPGVGVDAVIVSRARPVLPLLLLVWAWLASLAVALWAGRAVPRGAAGTGLGALRWAFSSPAGPGVVGVAGATPGPLPTAPPFAPPALAPLPSSSGTAGALSRAALASLLRLPWRKVLVLALAAALPLAPLSVRTPGGSFSPLELLLLLSLALGLLWVYLDPPLHPARPLEAPSPSPARPARPARWGLFAAPALLLLVAGVLSLLAAEYPRLALRELRVLVAGPVLYYFLARAALRGPRDALALGGAFLLGATGAAVLALSQVGLGWGLVAAEGVGRAVALYRSPNNLALLLDRALPLALSLALSARLVGWRSPFAAVTLLLALALFFTFSRGAWLAAACACAFVAFPALRRLSAPRRRRLALIALAAGTPALLLAGAVALRVERFRSLLAPEGTAVLRLRLWQSALEMVRDHPLGGIGLDQFLYLYPTYMHPDAWREPNLSHPHNLLLDFWLRLGLMGLVALAWAGWKALRRVQQRGTPVSGATDPDARASALAWGAAGALVAVVLHGALDNSYFVIDLAYGCWILLLILELATESAAPPASPSPAGGA